MTIPDGRVKNGPLVGDEPAGFARVLYVAYGAVVITVVMLTLWVVTGFVRRPSLAVALQRRASRLMLACLGCRYVVHGGEPASDAGPRVFVANHTSYLDIPLMLAVLRGPFVFVTKSELLGWPIIARITRAGGHIPVDRDRLESRGAVIGRIVKMLRAGRSVLVFPEGTFSHDDRLRSFQVGAFKAALAADAGVVPIALSGVARVWPEQARFPRPGTVEIWIGRAMRRNEADGDEAEQMEALRVATVQFIEGHLGRA